MVSVLSSGIRTGEIIQGTRTQSKGVRITIRGLYPPSRQHIDHTVIRDAFNNIEFFSAMTFDERLKWIEENATDDEYLYLSDTDIELKFEAIENEFWERQLTPEQITTLTNGEYFRMKDVYATFPRKEGSKALRHTLVFRPGLWELIPEKPKISLFAGIVINLDNCVIEDTTFRSKNYAYTNVVETYFGEVGYVSEVKIKSLTWEHVSSLTDLNLEPVYKQIKWFPPSMHKSFIQKIIRTRCKRLEHDGVYYDSKVALIASLAMLVIHAGSFVPNIQRFVTGTESAFKRIGVVIAEDSRVSDREGLALMFACGLLAQRDNLWKPSDYVITKMFALALEALKSERMYKYSFEDADIELETPLSYCAAFLKETKSFLWDIYMVKQIAKNDGRLRKRVELPTYFETIPMSHCIDFHAYPGMAHLMDEYSSSYSEISKGIWRGVSGINPRKIEHADAFQQHDEFIRDVRHAQLLSWKLFNSDRIERKSTGFIKCTNTIDESWLAGMVGSIEVKVGHSTFYVVMKVDDLYDFNVIKKPSRDKKSNPEPTTEESAQAIEKAKIILRKGVLLTVSNLPVFKGKSVKLVNDEYTIQGKSWSDAVDMEYNDPVVRKIEPSVENAVMTTGVGRIRNADNTVDEILKELDVDDLNRINMYMSNVRGVIQIYKIGRDGTGIDYAVKPTDTSAFHFFSKLACLYPGSIELRQNGFLILNGPVIWDIRDKVKSLCTTEVRSIVNWGVVEDDRVLYQHQVEAVSNMINKVDKGNAIWIPVGQGKTLIVIRYILELIEQQRMFSYCVYTLPPSALKSVKAEFLTHNFKCNVMDMREDGKNQTLKPGVINFVYHDHLRQGTLLDQFKKIASDTLFVVDEFHKQLSSKTIRTSVTLEMVRLSGDFIALSGTIIKDGDTTPLIAWLEQVVSFEVTPKNYYVAIGALISRKVTLPIEVDRQEIDCPMLSKKYKSVVPPTLGGTADNINFKKALEYSYESAEAVLMEDLYELLDDDENVFVNARNKTSQQEIHDLLLDHGLKKHEIFMLSKDKSIVWTEDNTQGIRVVISTPQYVEGYTATAAKYSLTPVFFSSQAGREQWEGRTVRLSQKSPEVTIRVYHSGLLSYVLKRYDAINSMASAIKAFAAEI